MRLLIIVLTLVLAVALLGFVLSNLYTRIDELTVWKTPYRDVPLYPVVFLSVLAGVIYAGIIGVGQGVQMWLANRRLTREIEKLETELNYLRTQPVIRPAAGEVVEPRETEVESRTSGSEDDEREAAAPPSAPVYGADDDEYPDDDVYSGGRAV
jgi:uncharacterized integral membrane protein